MTHCQRHVHFRSGFTLVEMSIVLVIIGLILGGIFVGMDLIHAATLRKVSSEYNKYATAYAAFVLKYNEIPGDMLDAQSVISASVIYIGDGNGLIDNWAESLAALQVLSLTGLIPGSLSGSPATPQGNPYTTPGANVPASSYGSNMVMWIQGFIPYTTGYYVYVSNHNWLSVQQGLAGYYPGQLTGLLPVDAQNIDQKLDDGRPFSGKIVQEVYAGCADLTSNTYTISLTTSFTCSTYYQLIQ